MFRVWPIVTVAGLLAAAGCATMTVSADFDPATNFGVYRTYDWAPPDPLPTGDPRLDANPFFDARVRAAVDGQLTATGLTQSADSPDLLVHYHASVRDRLDVYRIDTERGYLPGYEGAEQVSVYEEGTLLVDLVDAETLRVIWRGWAQTDIQGVIDNRVRMEQMIQEATRRMFERFPSQGGA